MPDPPFVEALLYGYFEPDFIADGRVTMNLEQPARGMILGEATPRIRIRDGRVLQSTVQEASGSEAAFFDRHGFVLLDHVSGVEDWDVETRSPEDDNALTRVYFPEIESLIRDRLLPGRRLEIFQGVPTRRGPGTPNSYATGVHQDFGVGPDAFAEGLAAFTTPEIGRGFHLGYERPEVERFVMIDFWRTVGMRGPLAHMPLAVCDPESVRSEDLVPLSVLGITPTGKPTNQLAARYRPDHDWYFYPGMRTDEVLAFLVFSCSKKDPEPARSRACFHSAFEDPRTPPDAEPRQSCEHRVSVFVLAD